jgi:hypothetical protein
LGEGGEGSANVSEAKHLTACGLVPLRLNAEPTQSSRTAVAALARCYQLLLSGQAVWPVALVQVRKIEPVEVRVIW